MKQQGFYQFNNGNDIESEPLAAGFVHFVDEAIFLIDTRDQHPARSNRSGSGFPAFKGVSHGITQQFVDSFDRALVRMLPIR